MGDISHNYGQDIDLSAGGDFLYLADETTQHVIKRLLTPPGGDIWNILYGAGLGQFVGQPEAVTAITNCVRSQIFQEASVSQIPEPIITVDGEPDSSVTVNIDYTDAVTGELMTLSFPLGN